MNVPKHNQEAKSLNISTSQNDLFDFLDIEDYEFIVGMAQAICDTTGIFLSTIPEASDSFKLPYGHSMNILLKVLTKNLKQAPIVIENIWDAPDFKNHPILSSGLQLSFIAIFPIVISSQPHPIGILGLFDSDNKKLSEEQQQRLQHVAEHLARILARLQEKLNLIQINQGLKKRNVLLQETKETNHIGIWEFDPDNHRTSWSQYIYTIHEAPLNYSYSDSSHIAHYHSDSKHNIKKAIDACIENGTPIDVIGQIETYTNRLKWVRTIGRKDGTKLIGSLQDITDIKLNEIRYKSIIESTNIGIWEWNLKSGQLDFNKQWGKIIGYNNVSAPTPIGNWLQLIHPNDQKVSNQKFNACFNKTASFYEFETQMRHQSGSWVWVYIRGKVLEWSKDGTPLKMYGILQDITPRKQKEETLRVSEEAFRGNFENAAIGMALLDEQGRWLKVNTKVCDIVGYTASELMALTFQDITYPEDLDSDLRLLQELVAGKRNHYEMEKRYFHKNGSIVHVLLAVSMVKDKEGDVLYFISQIIDISERKKLLLDINYQKDLLSALFNLSPIGIALNDFETGKFIDVNETLLAPTGYSKAEFLKLSYWDTTPKKYEPLERVALEQMQQQGSYELFEKEYIRKDGTHYPIALQGVVIKDAYGKKLIWSFIRDISKEKASKVKLHQALSHLQSILDSSKQVSIIATDNKGIITLFNSGAERMLGYGAQELVSIHSPKIIHKEDEVLKHSKHLTEKYQRDITGFETFVYEAKLGKASTHEWSYVRKDGSSFPVLLSVTSITNGNEIVGYLGVATDISELKKVENEIKSLLDITNEQNERLRNFAHIVSHNLRSHSGGISGILDLIDLEAPDLRQNELIKMLQTGADNLKQTVSDLTEIVKVNLTQAKVSEIVLHEVIIKNIASLNLPIKQADLTIINTVAASIKVKAVPAYMDSIVLNMLTNAIKYKRDLASSFLKISTEETDTSIAIHFEDNGLGIDLKKYGDKIFGMYKTFHRHDDSRGVGLFITKNQIESIGGKIDVKSEVNQGTTFIITLPK